MEDNGKEAQKMIRDYVGRLQVALDALEPPEVAAVVQRLYTAYRDGRQVFIVGNGGSASTASHMACDLAKNIFAPGRPATPNRFRVISLTDNVAMITALGNDLGYDQIFSEQLRNLAVSGDLLIAVSGSGNSPNLLEALKVSRTLGLYTIGILGFGGGKVKDLVDLSVVVSSHEYGPVEDTHLVLNHILVTCLRAMVSS